jgi:outer membrane cobalamin receptor
MASVSSLCWLFLFFCFVPLATAQDNLELEGLSSLFEEEAALTQEAEVVVTSARYGQRVDRTPSHVQVISRHQIEALHPKSVGDLLRFIPGFTVLRRQQLGQEISAFGVGGQFSNKILVLLDGHRVTEPTFGMVPWQDLPIVLEEVERIEVVLGPESTLYGSNAFSGVVNIITGAHHGKDVERLTLRGGNRGFSDLSYHRSTRLPGGGSLAVSLLEEQRGSFGALVDGAGNPDPFFHSGEEIGRRVLRVTHRSAPDRTWQARYSLGRVETSQTYLPLAPGSQRELDSENLSSWLSLDLERALAGERRFSLRASYSDLDRKLSTAPFAVFGIPGNHLDSSGLNVELSLSDRIGPWTLAGGVSGRRVSTSTYLTSGLDDDAQTTEFFLHGEREIGERLVLFLGARQVYQQLAEDELSWKVAGLYRPRWHTALRLSMGTSFRQPDLVSARFVNVNSFRGAPTNQPVFATNSNLSNEVARGFVQFGLERHWERTLAKVDLYTASLQGMISLVPFGPPVVAFTPAPVTLPIRPQRWENATGEARLRGGTLALEQEIGVFRLAFGGNYQRVRGISGTQGAPYAPRRSETLVLELPRERRRWGGAITLSRVSGLSVDTNALLDGASPTLPDYTTVDLHLTRSLARKSSLTLSVRNLLDKQHREMIYSLVGDSQEQGVSFGREVWLSYRVDL